MSWGKRVPPSTNVTTFRKPLEPTLSDEDITLVITPTPPIAINRSASPSQKDQIHQSFNSLNSFNLSHGSSISSSDTFDEGMNRENKGGILGTTFTNDLKTSLLFQGVVQPESQAQVDPTTSLAEAESEGREGGKFRRPSNATTISLSSNLIPAAIAALATTRRIISNPYSSSSTSPRSPLSNGAHFPHSLPTTSFLPQPHPSSSPTFGIGSAISSNSILTGRRRSSQLLIPLSPPRTSNTNRRISFSNSNNNYNNNSNQLNQSVVGGIGGGGGGGGSFVGSYENSLLNNRMSSQPSNLPLPFLASIGVLITSTLGINGEVVEGGGGESKIVKCPPHLNLKFAASYYPNPSTSSSSSSSNPSSSSTISPYVGTIDLESHYFSLLSPPSPFSTSTTSTYLLNHQKPKMKIPKFPGYELFSPKGQLQLILKNPNSTTLKIFLLPFDLTGLSREGKGGRTFLRQKSYAFENGVGLGGEEGGKKERLKFAVHVQFCSPPTSSMKTTTTKLGHNGTKKKLDEPKYYLYGTVRVVFTSRALDLSEKLRIVLEGPEGILTPPVTTSSSSSASSSSNKVNPITVPREFSEYLGAGKEWDLSRKKLKELLKRDELVNDIEKDRIDFTSSTVIGFNPILSSTTSINTTTTTTTMVKKKKQEKKIKVFDPNHVEDDDDDEDEEAEEDQEETEGNEEPSRTSNRNTLPSTPITTSSSGPSFLSLHRPLLSTPPSPPLIHQSRLYSKVLNSRVGREEQQEEEESFNHQALVLAFTSSSGDIDIREDRDREVNGK